MQLHFRDTNDYGIMQYVGIILMLSWESVIPELNDILATGVELVLHGHCPNDDDCDKNKIKPKYFSEDWFSHVAV